MHIEDLCPGCGSYKCNCEDYCEDCESDECSCDEPDWESIVRGRDDYLSERDYGIGGRLCP